MNIFYLDENPKICAEYHCDKHIVKMCIEYSQILSTAHRVLDGEIYIDDTKKRKIKRYKLNNSLDDILYKSTHINHPSCIWVRENKLHYEYLYNLLIECLNEFTNRYNKIHACSKLIAPLNNIPINIPYIDFTQPPLCMPEDCHIGNSIESYRQFYKVHKRKFCTWKNRIPHWFDV